MSTPNFREHACTLVLELVTPLHIGSGEPDGGSDAGVVRDFNGLPGIPGSSIQGMLRAAVEAAEGPEAAERIFGHSSQANQGTGRGGRLTVSWGLIHKSDDKPVAGRISQACRDSDAVLRDGARPMLRDHVRLNERGVADGRGKFDELVVSAGHRFTVHLWFATAGSDDRADWETLAKVLRNPDLRLGGKTRRGLGAFKIKSWIENDAVKPIAPVASEMDSSLSREFMPETLWMFGGGASESADSAPVSGTWIVWDAADKGSVQPVWILPGSGIKGALGHRTMFHANRLAGYFIDKQYASEAERDVAKQKAQDWVGQLFGMVRGKQIIPGQVFIDDVAIPRNDAHLADVQNHVAINPFTGGAKDSALFNDEPLKPRISPVKLIVKVTKGVSADAKAALKAALDDLAVGRLALGAHAGRGYGFFKASDAKRTSRAEV